MKSGETEEIEGTGTELEVPESARDVTAAVFDELEAGEAGPEAEETAAPTEGEERPSPARDDQGRFAKGDEKPAARKGGAPARATAAGPTAAGAPRPGQVIPPAPGTAAAPASPAVKPPASWKPAAREEWGKLPPIVQEEITRVGRETARVLQENAQLRQSGAPMQEAVRPYELLFRSANMAPEQYVGSMLQTAHALANGPPHVQADTLAALVMQFAPHLLRSDQTDAEGRPSCPLDRALVARMQGQALQPGAGGAQPAQLRDPRLDQLLARMDQQRQERSQRLETESVATAEQFGAAHEFFDDVRGTMADILDTWAKQGKTEVSEEEMEQAYTIACQMNPDVAPYFEQRRAAAAATKARASTSRAARASVSVRASPAVPAPEKQGKLTARQITEQALEEIEGRV